MSYTINPNAKNRWARNAENTMDLSLETDASSVYLDNGRTLEQEIGEGSMVSNVVTIDSGMEKVIDGTYDGAYESCKMYGKSLVNLATHSKRQNINVQNLLDSNGRLSWNTTGVWGKVGFTVQGKPNSTYCVKYGDKHTTLRIYVRYVDGLSGTTQPITALNSTCKKFTTDTTGIFTLTLEQSEATTDSWIQDFMILEYQEGMENWDIPYFEGLCDVKMPILRNVGKNLIPLPLIANTGLTWVDGVEHKPSSDYSFTTTGFIKIQTGVYYTSSNTSNMGKRVHCYDEGKRHLGVLKTDGSIVNSSIDVCTSHTFKIDDKNVCYIRLTFYGVLEAAQLEESSTATSYEDHKSNILETSNDLVLRGLPSGIRDTYDCLTGEYIRRVGERDYQESDESDSNVITDLVKTHYELAEPIVTHIEPSTTPFAYQNGHIILESGHEGQSLLPTLEYSTVINRTGQVENVAKTIQRQEKQLTMLEKMLIQNIINLDYNNTLLTLKNEMEEML